MTHNTRMTHKSLLAASAVVTLLAVSPGAQAGDCLFGDRTGVRTSTAVERTDRIFHRTDRMLRRTGDAIVRTGDRMFGWLNRRTRT